MRAARTTARRAARTTALWLLASAAPAMAQQSGGAHYSLFNPVPHAALRELTTDRPDKTESPYTVDAGHLQIELDFATYTRDRSGSERTETFNIAPVNLKLGLSGSTDVQLVFDSYLRQTVTDRSAGTRDRTGGFGDVTIRLKHNLWGNDGGATALALMPFVKLPTNTNGFGNNATEFGLIVPLALTISPRIGIGLMTEIDLREQSDGHGYAPTFINSATIAFELTGKLGLYSELFTERGTERDARWVVTGDVGLTYALSKDAQLDTGVNLGLTDAADDVGLFVGFSRRF